MTGEMNRYFAQNLSAEELLAKTRQRKAAQPDSSMAETLPVVPKREIRERRIVISKEDPEISERYQMAPYELVPGHDDAGPTNEQLDAFVHPPKFVSDVPPDRPTMKSVYRKEDELETVESGVRTTGEEVVHPQQPDRAA